MIFFFSIIHHFSHYLTRLMRTSLTLTHTCNETNQKKTQWCLTAATVCSLCLSSSFFDAIMNCITQFYVFIFLRRFSFRLYVAVLFVTTKDISCALFRREWIAGMKPFIRPHLCDVGRLMTYIYIFTRCTLSAFALLVASNKSRCLSSFWLFFGKKKCICPKAKSPFALYNMRIMCVSRMSKSFFFYVAILRWN